MKKLIYLFLFVYLFSLSWDGYLLLSTSIPFSISFLALGLLTCIFLVHSLIERRKIRVSKLLSPIFALLIYMFISILWSHNQTSIFSYFTILSYFITVFIIFNLVLINKIKISVITGYFLGVMSVGVYTYFTSELTLSRFSITEGFNPTWFAAQIIWAIIISMYFIQSSKPLLKIALLLSDVFLVFLLLLTGGRNALIALVLGIIISTFYIYKKHIGLLIKYLVLISVLGLSAYYVIDYTIGTEVLGRIADIQLLFTGDSNQATAGRTTIWNNYLNAIDSYLIFGSGFHSSYTIMGISAHNVFLTVLFEFGFIGLSIFMIFMFKILRSSLVILKKFHYTLFTLSLALFFLGFGNDTLYYKYWWTGIVLFFIIYAVSSREQQTG